MHLYIVKEQIIYMEQIYITFIISIFITICVLFCSPDEGRVFGPRNMLVVLCYLTNNDNHNVVQLLLSWCLFASGYIIYMLYNI